MILYKQQTRLTNTYNDQVRHGLNHEISYLFCNDDGASPCSQGPGPDPAGPGSSSDGPRTRDQRSIGSNPAAEPVRVSSGVPQGQSGGRSSWQAAAGSRMTLGRKQRSRQQQWQQMEKMWDFSLSSALKETWSHQEAPQPMKCGSVQGGGIL